MGVLRRTMTSKRRSWRKWITTPGKKLITSGVLMSAFILRRPLYDIMQSHVMGFLRKFDFGPLNFSSIFTITRPYPILSHFSIVRISEFVSNLLTSNLSQNRKFELLKSGPKSGHVIINMEEKLSGPKSISLRVVRTLAILFLKSMSYRGGSDIERLWIWMTSIDFESI